MTEFIRTIVPGIWEDCFEGLKEEGSGRLRTSDFFLNISRGSWEGISSQFKFGRNPDVSVTEEVIWDGGNGYVFLDAAETMSIVSTSADDTNGGDGAWNLILYGLDDDFNEIFETVTLAGLTPVITTNSYRRVYRAFILQSGIATATEDANIGDITITSTTTANIQAQITQHNGQTLMCVWTVPSGYTAYITGISLNVGQGKQCLFRAKFRNCATANCAFTTKYAIDIYQNTFFGELKVPLKVPEKTDVVITAQMSATPAATATASFGAILIEN